MPVDSGIYLLKDDAQRVIYVGKAKNLRARLRSYFSNRSKQSTDVKLQALIAACQDFEVIVTSNEVEALLLERTWIRQQKPKYNVLLRDDKEYPYLRIDWQETWPRLEKVRRQKQDGAQYFGPYGRHLNLLLALLHRMFPLIRCTRKQFKLMQRPCNYYQMRMCLAPCVYAVPKQKYLKMLKRAVAVIEGNTKMVKSSLQRAMRAASGRQEYEEAASYRDQLKALEQTQQRQIAVLTTKLNADVFGLALKDKQALVYLLMVRDGCISAQDHFVLSCLLGDEQQVLSQFLLQFYEHRQPPELILLPAAVEKALHTVISGIRTVSVRADSTTPRAQGRAGSNHEQELLALAQKNAEQQLQLQYRDINTELRAVQDLLKLKKLPRTIECVDISNLQGTAIVAAIVCFVDGVPAKSRYRRYKIGGDKPDDYASIRSVVQRRWRRALRNHDAPDLLLIDGGKGQLQAARSAVGAQADLVIASIAKSRSRQTSSRAVASGERLYLAGEDAPIALPMSSHAFRIIVQLRDEAHRFALLYHRSLRGNELLRGHTRSSAASKPANEES